MRYSTLFLAAATVSLLPGVSLADDASPFQAGSVMLRARAIDVDPQVSSAVSVINGSVHAGNNLVPEVDGSYFFTPNVAAELIAAVTYHTVKDVNSAAGTLPLGSVRLLPPTLTAQWHFLPEAKFNPYVGAGINYTFFYGVKGSTVPIIYSTHYSDNVGGALQAGFDYRLSGNWFLNVDAKKLFLHTDVTLGTKVGQVKASVDLDPWIVGAGVGYKF
ncbi:MAG: OmpW family protein [Burkholderiaceae bacterium]|nr:OmpW family protein [Burkholderiaceae bacterium]